MFLLLLRARAQIDELKEQLDDEQVQFYHYIYSYIYRYYLYDYYTSNVAIPLYV